MDVTRILDRFEQRLIDRVEGLRSRAEIRLHHPVQRRLRRPEALVQIQREAGLRGAVKAEH